MLTSCMLWDALILKIYPTLAKTDIRHQFRRFRTEGLLGDFELPSAPASNAPRVLSAVASPPTEEVVGTSLNGHIDASRDEESPGPAPSTTSLQETLNALSFNGIMEMNQRLADHENVTQALETFNTVILVYGLSNADRLGLTDLLAHISLLITFMFLSFSALVALGDIDKCFAEEVRERLS